VNGRDVCSGCGLPIHRGECEDYFHSEYQKQSIKRDEKKSVNKSDSFFSSEFKVGYIIESYLGVFEIVEVSKDRKTIKVLASEYRSRNDTRTISYHKHINHYNFKVKGKGKVYSDYQLAMAAEDEINACADDGYDYGEDY
jgi:hypothetical protein